MKPVLMLTFATLFAIAGTAQAQEPQRGECPERGRCVMPPIPPIPPMPPIPPVPPTPPAPPPAPVIPQAAHDACAGKAIDSALTFRPKRGIVMTGTCQKDSKGMYFDMNTLHIEK